MKGFNLSEWGLRHQSLVLYFIIASTIAGVVAYFQLGRQEDPEFTIKTMVVQAFWPGATAREQELQVTDKLEKKLQELPYFDFIASYSKPGESTLKVNLRQDTPAKAVPDIWYQVRKKIADIQTSLPQGVQGPFFNDEFGDTFGVIYAFHGDGFSSADLKKILEDVRQQLLSVKDVSKVDIVGAQDEKIFVDFSHKKLAAMGVTPQTVLDALQKFNTMTPSGVVEAGSDRIAVRVSTTLDTLSAVRDVPIVVGGRPLRIEDVAEVTRGYQDPPAFTMAVNGKPVIGLAISMQKGGNVLALGQALDAKMAQIKRELPLGVEVEQIGDQPKVVKASIDEFMMALAEALGIVLVVSFISLGMRTGFVVALSVPLVLAITFVAMMVMGIDFHRISLGALIISLGLLVDDAIIAVEMMVVKMEQGYDRIKAASFAFTSTAFPMLTGTIVTAAGFVPVGFAKSNAGEYTNAIFWVVALSLMISWIVAVLFTPYLGYKLLPDFSKGGHGHHDPYQTRSYRVLRAVIDWCVSWRKTVVLITVVTFALSVWGFKFVEQQFFPSASRPELMIDLRLPEGASIKATQAQAKRIEDILAKDPDVRFFTTYVGGGTVRFYLPLNPELRQANFAQFVVMTKGLDEREHVFARLQKAFDEEFDAVRARVQRLENGPPVGFPVQFRVIGKDPMVIRDIADQVRTVMRENPHVRDIHFDWNEMAKSVRLEIDRDRARALGVNPQDLALTLNTLLAGQRATQFRDGIELIDVTMRAAPDERLNLDDLANINVWTASGAAVPLSQLGRVQYGLEEPILWRRNREVMMTVRADIRDNTQAPVVTAQIDPMLNAIRARLPDGYRIDIGGAVEESVKSQQSIFAVMPLMVLIMVTVLMLQLQSFSRLFLVLLTAPLGMIGVTAALILFHQPFGFVAMLGVISLAGMIMRNSVILVDQIDQDIKAGIAPWEAVIGATVRRARPIALTAAAAILAMIPLSRSVFWGPMAIAIMGGLAIATLLTLFFLPALYAMWFRIKRDAPAVAPAPKPAAAPLGPVQLAPGD